MVWNEIQQQAHTSPRKFAPSHFQAIWSSQFWVYFVTPYAIRRTHVVWRAKVRKCPPEILQEARIPIGYRDTGRAPRPNAHQPHGIEPELRDSIPFARRYAA